MNRVRVGVIGVGAMGRHHARVYSKLKEAKLVGVMDANISTAKKVAETYKTKAYSDYNELLASVDAVSIAVPTSFHKEMAITAAEYGVDMLIEKPIAESLSSAEKIIEVAKETGVKVMVGHIERFNPAVLKLKKLIDSGELGRIATISGKRLGPLPPRIKDVGIILDLAVHEIDTFSYLLGERAESVFAIAGNNFHHQEDYASILIGFPGNKSCVVETNWLSPKKIRNLMVFGTEAVASLDYIEQRLEIWRNYGSSIEDVKKREPLVNELKTFLNCIQNDEQPKPSGEDGRYVLAVAISAIKSYREKRPVNIANVISESVSRNRGVPRNFKKDV